MANDLLVRILGDSRSLERAFARSSKSASTFAAQTTTGFGRVEAGFARLQRVAAGGFIGGAALVAARRFVDVAAEAQQVLGQTQVAVESSGLSWERYARTIEETIAAQSRLGFDDEALLQTFSLFVRQADDVGAALQRNNLAMDVARARFIDLEQAAQIVNKAALGQAGALRRLGIDAEKGASSVELLAKLQAEFGGAAEAASDDAKTAMDRFQVSAENAQEAIGTLLLPAVEKLADGLVVATDVLVVLTEGLSALGDIKIPPIRIPFFFDFPGAGTVGSLAGKAVDIVPWVVAPFPRLFGEIAQRVAQRFDEEASKQTPELAASFRKSLDTMMTDALKAAGAAAGPKPEDFAKQPGVDFGHADTIIGAVQGAIAAARKAVDDAIKKGNAAIAKDNARKAAERRADSIRNVIEGLELNVDRAGLKAGLADDLAALQALRAGLERQIKAGVDVTQAQSRLVGVMREIRDVQEQVRGASAEALQARQFRALGLSATGAEVVPGVDNLRKQLEQLSERLAGANIQSKLVNRLAGVRKLLKGQFGQLTEETRAAIRDLFSAIRDEFNDQGRTGPLTATQALRPNQILKGLGLDAATLKEIRRRLSGFNTAGVALAGRGTAGAVTGGAPIVVNTTVQLDGQKVGQSTKRFLLNDRRHNPPQKRGPNSG